MKDWERLSPDHIEGERGLDYPPDRAREWTENHPGWYAIAALGFWAILIYALAQACS